MIEIEQLEMDFGSSAGDGYESWKRDQEQAVREIAEIWALPLNRKVHLKLANIDSEFEGVLTLAERPLTLNRKQPLILRLKPLKFSSDEIDRCVVME